MNLLSRLKKVKDEKKLPHKDHKVSSEKESELDGIEKENSFGKYFLIEKEYSLDNLRYPKVSKNIITKNLRLLRGIGPVTDEKFKQQEINDLNDLKFDVRWKSEIEVVNELIKNCNIKELKRRGACDYELLSFFDENNLVILDIETTGLWANQPLFLIGILFKDNNKLKLQQYLARNLQEEKALLFAVYTKLKNFSLMATYNGKKFDVPFMEGRFTEHRFFYKLNHYQLDILKHTRRHFKNIYPDCCLTTIEEYLLNFKREGDIPGCLIPRTYYEYVKTKDYNLIKDIISHNALDLISLAKILFLTQPEIDEHKKTS